MQVIRKVEGTSIREKQYFNFAETSLVGSRELSSLCKIKLHEMAQNEQHYLDILETSETTEHRSSPQTTVLQEKAALE